MTPTLSALLDGLEAGTVPPDALIHRVRLARNEMGRLAAERDNWIETARQHCVNEDYYRGLVQQIGAALGPDAYVSDDGSVQQDVLCAKVPELVVARLTSAAHAAAGEMRERCALIADEEQKRRLHRMDNPLPGDEWFADSGKSQALISIGAMEVAKAIRALPLPALPGVGWQEDMVDLLNAVEKRVLGGSLRDADDDLREVAALRARIGQAVARLTSPPPVEGIEEMRRVVEAARVVIDAWYRSMDAVPVKMKRLRDALAALSTPGAGRE